MLLGKRVIMMSGGDVVILGVVTIATDGNYMKYKKVGECSSTFYFTYHTFLFHRTLQVLGIALGEPYQVIT